MTWMSKAKHGLSGAVALLRRAIADRRGVVSVEFAMIMPLFVLTLFGTFSAFDALRASQRVSESAAIVSDLATRVTTMDDATRDNLFSTADALSAGLVTPGTVRVTMSSIALRLDEGEETVEIIWSEASSGLPLQSLEGMTLPTIPLGSSVIVVEVEAAHEPVAPIADLFNVDLYEIAVRRPRFTNEIVYETNE